MERSVVFENGTIYGDLRTISINYYPYILE